VAVGSEEFLGALRQWASGVTVVTSRSGDVVHGMTVSAFASVSLDPPMVLVCADKASNTHGLIAEAGVFAVHVLARDQEKLSNLFASKKDEQRRFEGVEWTTAVTGAPILPGAVAVLDCRVVAAHDAGDHVIYVGDVAAARTDGGDPLLYHGGGYRSLAARTSEPETR
jgi:flavin reductase (DIM6/NTAB) family NADH-FMN oxidoreductase RutF